MTTTTSPPALEATGLRKSFGDTVALDGIDLSTARSNTLRTPRALEDLSVFTGTASCSTAMSWTGLHRLRSSPIG